MWGSPRFTRTLFYPLLNLPFKNYNEVIKEGIHVQDFIQSQYILFSHQETCIKKNVYLSPSATI